MANGAHRDRTLAWYVARRPDERIRLDALEGDRKGQYSISINAQWHICFRFVDGDAYDVVVCDYH